MTENRIKTDPFAEMMQPTPKPAVKPVVEKTKPPIAAPQKEQKKTEVVTNAPGSADVNFLLQTLSLSQSMIDWLDDKAHEVKKTTGFRKANRSSVARYAISKIQNEGIDHNDFMDFVKKEQGLK